MRPLRSLPGRPAHPYVPQGYPKQLEMVRTSTQMVPVPRVPEGYVLRQFRSGDEAAYEDLFHLAFEVKGRLPQIIKTSLEAGFFVVEHLRSGHLVASCVAQRSTKPDRHPNEGQLGWLVTDPSHTGKKLGTIVAACVTNRLVEAGFRQAFLGTDDFRAAAIGIYLRLAWRPFLYEAGMEDRWRAVYRELDRPFDHNECAAP